MITVMPKAGVRFVFWAAFTASFIILTFIITFGLHFADRLLFGGARRLGGHMGLMAMPVIVFSILIATATCRGLGISADSKTTEMLRRSPKQTSPDLEAVELRISRTLWSSLALLMDGFGLLLVLAVYYLPSVPGTQGTGYGIAAFFALFSLGPWYGFLTRNGLVARVDAQGVRAESAGPKSFVPWEQIAACEVLKVQDVLGEDFFTRYIFEDANGTLLMTLSLLCTTKEDRKRFEHAVRAALV